MLDKVRKLEEKNGTLVITNGHEIARGIKCNVLDVSEGGLGSWPVREYAHSR